MKILLITSGDNSDKSSSWLVYSKFISFMRTRYNANIEIICFTPNFFKSKSGLGEKTFNAYLTNDLIVSALSRLNKSYILLVSKFYSKIYYKNIYRYIEKNKIEKLWIKADLLPFLVLNKIVNIKNIPYHISVLDDPFRYKGFKYFEDEINILFKKLFNKTSSIDTPTSYLSNYYISENIINIKTKTTESFVGIFKKSKPPKINDKVRKIALTGSIYGMDALISFLSAVNEILYNEKIEFHLMTNTFKVHTTYLKSKYKETFDNIKILPFIPEHKIINELQNYDLLYLPMKFDESFRFQTNSSFPSKTHNYLASQIPIIVHTPNASSLYNFFVNNDIGCVIDTLNNESISTKFINLLDKNNRLEISNKTRIFNELNANNTHIDKLYEIINY